MLHWPVEFSFFIVFPKCVCLSLLQLVVKPALNAVFHLLLLVWFWPELCQGLYPIVFQQLPSLVSLLSFQTSEFQDTTVGFDCCLSNCCGISAFKGYCLSVSSALPLPYSSSLVLALLSHWNPSLIPTSHLAVYEPCSSWYSCLCSFFSDYRSFNFPCWPLFELLYPALTPHFISSCYLWQSLTSWLLSCFQPLSSSGCFFVCSSFLLAVSYLCLYCSTLHTICCAAACMTHPENNKNPTAFPVITLGSQRRHAKIYINSSQARVLMEFRYKIFV